MKGLDKLNETLRELVEERNPGFKEMRQEYIDSLPNFSTDEIDMILTQAIAEAALERRRRARRRQALGGNDCECRTPRD